VSYRRVAPCRYPTKRCRVVPPCHTHSKKFAVDEMDLTKKPEEPNKNGFSQKDAKIAKFLESILLGAPAARG